MVSILLFLASKYIIPWHEKRICKPVIQLFIFNHFLYENANLDNTIIGRTYRQ